MNINFKEDNKMPNNETKSLNEMHPSKNVKNSGKKPMSVAERNMQAAIERAEEREANKNIILELQEKGFKDINSVDSLKPLDKVYFNNL